MNKEFIKKFANIQKKVNVEKNGYNGFGKYNYRTIDDMLSVIKPLLADAGIVLYFYDEIIQMGKKMSLMTVSKEAKWDSTKKVLVTTSQNQELKEVDRIILKTTIIVTDGENHLTNSAYADIDTTASMSDEQKVGAASTYARKYALNGMFAIDDGKLDPDAKPEPDTNKPDNKPESDIDNNKNTTAGNKQKEQNKEVQGTKKAGKGKLEPADNDLADKAVVDKMIAEFAKIGIKEPDLLGYFGIKREQIKQSDIPVLRAYFVEKKAEYQAEQAKQAKTA